ncbi:hypothetical protein PoB_007408900 [Plakobranchus ocellatus]|uniref:Myb-like domain-containing protein n=1 Tax=Plakobranchus ocellatus TaxID=259542 RepID=A0AAV4DTT9_9GAST|nr:hypothetical protein PoB_007408900 [Plakobranchus ocellatus]
MGARVRFNAECDLLLLEQAVACRVYQQQGGRGWKAVASNLYNLHEKFQYITPRCARERTQLLVAKYATETGQTPSGSNGELEKSEKAILLNQLLHSRQKGRQGGAEAEANHTSEDLPDSLQPKIEFPESTQSIDSFPDSANNGQMNESGDYDIAAAVITNGNEDIHVYRADSVPRSPRGRKRKAASPRRVTEDKEHYLLQLVSSLEETSRKHTRLLEEELDLRRREFELRAQRLQMEMAERTAMVDLIKALVDKI